MSAVRAALRISRRDMWRAKGRSLLILVMIGLPVLAITAAAVYTLTSELDPRERLRWELGSAAALVTDTKLVGPIRQNAERPGLFRELPGTPRPPMAKAEIEAAIGPGARVIRSFEGYGEYQERDGYRDAVIWEADARDPVTTSRFHLLDGRFPQAEDEVAVSDVVGVPVGNVLRVTRDGIAKRVVGVVRASPPKVSHNVRQIITLPGALLDGVSHQSRWLIETRQPVTWDRVRQANDKGLTVLSRAVLDDPPASADGQGDLGGSLSWNETLVAAVLVTQVVLLAGPAFAVGLRRRRRELALIAAQGGSARHLKLIVISDGLVLGAGASVLGAVLGVGVARVIVSAAGQWPDGELGPFDVPVGLVAVIVALGTLSGLTAAIVPAVQAARWDVAAALAGRRDTRRDRAGRPLLGTLVAVLGVAVLAYAALSGRLDAFIAGALLGQLGLVMIMPWLIRRIGPLAGRLPLPLRLAVRDGVRNRGRTAPAVVAVMAAAATFGMIVVSWDSSAARNEQRYRGPYTQGTTAIYGAEVTEESWRTIRGITAKTLPGVPLIEAFTPVDAKGEPLRPDLLERGCDGCRVYNAWDGLPLGGPDLLRYVLGRTDPAAEAALAAGRAVVFNQAGVRNGEVALTLPPQRGTTDAEPARVSLPATFVRVDGPATAAGVAPVSAFTSRGYAVRLTHLLVDPQVRRLMPAEVRRLDGPVRAVTAKVAVAAERAPDIQEQHGPHPFIIAAALIALAATFSATALAAADSRGDMETLTALGARPRTRRAVVAGQAAFIAGLGVPIGLLAGLGLAAVESAQLAFNVLGMPPDVAPNGYRFPDPGLVLAVPWAQFVAVAVGLPLLAALVAGLFARTRVRVSRRVA
ncbi:ABC transporter permease [Microtetraspora malaysiensis]|uniref:ABC transporter permease n=1 Tax=Microtetraspora malaysiensis TaxID=161358 RepID=UPI00082B42A5|nr:FtsX-like permease family protein [Microtetraspora malaysiensis]